MLRLIAKYRLYFILSGMLIALCCVLQIGLSAGAVSRFVSPPGNDQQNSQMYHGASFLAIVLLILGVVRRIRETLASIVVTTRTILLMPAIR